jgi:hypothetical protein
VSTLRLLLFGASLPLIAAGQPQPAPGALGTVLRRTPVYVNADLGSQRLDVIEAGRELVVMEQNGPWVRVLANTDKVQDHAPDEPELGGEAPAPPVSGWVQDKGIVTVNTPGADTILYGAAVGEEAAASSSGPGTGRAARAARRLYERDFLLFPQGPHAGEAAWRAADIAWQLQKADIATLPSAHEQASYLRPQIDETAMKRIVKRFPGTRYADLAEWDMIDNRLCGDWQGSAKCPEKEAEIYQRYADAHPDSPNAARSLYEAVYRLAAAGDLYQADNDAKRAAASRDRAAVVARHLPQRYPQSDDSARSATLIYQMEQSLPIYGAARD